MSPRLPAREGPCWGETERAPRRKFRSIPYPDRNHLRTVDSFFCLDSLGRTLAHRVSVKKKNKRIRVIIINNQKMHISGQWQKNKLTVPGGNIRTPPVGGAWVDPSAYCMSANGTSSALRKEKQVTIKWNAQGSSRKWSRSTAKTNLLPDKIVVGWLVHCCSGWRYRKHCWIAEAIGFCPHNVCLPDWTSAYSTLSWRPND